MGRTYEAIDGRLAAFLSKQPIFFVATAPLSAEGHVNCSPKGNDGMFAVLNERCVAYTDMTGSGIETIAHLRENGRIVLMFCAFEGPARIVRLHGQGEAIMPDDDRFPPIAERMGHRLGLRAIVKVDVTRVSDSCGYGVPIMSFERHRSNLDSWTEKKGEDGLAAYRAKNNRLSLDALPGLDVTSLEELSDRT